MNFLNFLNSLNFLNFFLQNMGRDKKLGGQLGVASWGWLQSPFFIVCLNQGHFFSNFFFINFYDFFEFFSSKYHEKREKMGWPAWGGQLGLAAVSLLHSLS
jgi:hypothetical protein